MERVELVHQRNSLMVKLMWFSLFLGTSSNILTGSSWSVTYFLIGFGTATCAFLQVLVQKKLWAQQIRYFVVALMVVIASVMMYTGESLIYYFMVYFNVVLVALYQDWRPIVLSGLHGVVVTNYFFLTRGEQWFPNLPELGLAMLNMFVVLVSILLLIQAQFAVRARQALEDKQRETEAMKDQIESLFQQVQASVGVLGNFGTNLQQNITITQTLSTEVTSAFTEIATSIDAQSSSVQDITTSMQEVNADVQSVALASSTMRELSGQTAEVTAVGNDEMRAFLAEMHGVGTKISSAVQLIGELNEQAQLIENILETIRGIAAQTNLLALNATIEAARAGEEGRSFSVVATEVRKLAEDSLHSTKEIANVLGEIQRKTGAVKVQVNDGQAAVLNSHKVVERVEHIFREITGNTEQVVQQSRLVAELVQKLQQNSDVIVTEIDAIADVTSDTTAAVQEILANVEEQNRRVEDVVESFTELDGQLNGLGQLTQVK